MARLEFQKLLQNYLDGRCTPQEEQFIKQRYKELAEAKDQLLTSAEQEVLLGAMWQRLEARLELPVPVAKEVQLPIPLWRSQPLRWAAAALVIFAVGVGQLLPSLSSDTNQVAHTRRVPTAGDTWTQYSQLASHPRVISLPDGSQVTLSSGSTLRYATGLTGPKREVYLTGEGFFKVSKNPARPFLVITKQVVTTVLGTSFRVSAYEGSPNATVMVREGRVAVQARVGAKLEATPDQPAAAGVLLLPNQQVTYSAASNRLKKELVAKPLVLTPQSFVFDEAPVSEVLMALSKAYGVEIVYEREDLAACTVTLALANNKSLYNKLDVLCETLGASYEESNARILFHSKGCKNK